ncbi:ABC transporter ATP-binding protein/permease [Herbiconiux sp. CPCC 203407]|uniref:ABC transporter ATP-binding protein/permease n=1 Tax=Herbiconiux oxytropis TaxID=2970915 RepID=A0AA41XAV4_9MICO|nr:ABC transporter ATP-binding protein [Herbiconiux oxytropis]MCS5721145.1 ABC transporter ATP-binding protein/permease [Herbiconiux oxytropis]MCS5724797.1 ABC transporter ATP-binding protein/permease [Herbiconiux oxytropis]
MPEPTNPQSAVGTVAVLSRLRPYVREALPRIYAAMVVSVVASAVALAIPQVLQWMVDGPLADGDPGPIWVAAGIVLALGVLEAVLIGARRALVLTPGTHVEARLRNSLYRRLQNLPVAFHDRWPSGQLLSRAVSDLNLIRRWLSFGLVLLVVNVLTIIGGAVILIALNWVLGLIFVAAAVPVILYSFSFERKYSDVARRSQDQTGDLATSVEESVHGIRVLKAFGRGRYALKRFESQAEQLRGTEIEKAKAIAGIWLYLTLIPDLAFGVCLVVGVWLASTGQSSVGELVAFFATGTVLLFPIWSLGYFLAMTLDAKTATLRFFEVMDAENTIIDPEQPAAVSRGRGELVFDDVHFRYQDAPATFPDLVDGVSLTVQPGETMALVGLTGSGKSTLTALTTRLYDVTGGSVRVDGVDVRDLALDDLRSRIAMAFEEATLFSRTVRENVLLGRPDASEEDLREALNIAQASFVDDLPAGLDTKVGEEGLSLSGGQRQRLALARAIAARPEILVLDDPLSALDVDTEALVEAALRRVLATTTALIVAHRPSTVALADRVALLENGRITAVGTHSELLASSAHYRFVISSFDSPEVPATEEVSR